MSAVALAQLPDWPAAMPCALAPAYTSVADAQMKEWKRRGLVSSRPRGLSGAQIATRASLDHVGKSGMVERGGPARRRCTP